jgi:hypothetical protein
MCWFLCANPIVNQWLRQDVDAAGRKALALKPLLAADLLEADGVLDGEDVSIGVRVAAPPGARVRAVLRADLFIVPRIETRSWRVSSQLRNKPFEFLAHAWSRFLLWLGRR